MTSPQDVLMIVVGVLGTLAVSFVVSVWFLHGTTIGSTLRDTQRGDKPGD